MPCNRSDGMGDAYREDPVAQRSDADMPRGLQPGYSILRLERLE